MLFGVSIVAAWALLTLSIYVVPQFAADVYDLLIVRMTTRWYAAVLKELRPRDRLLDIGIGTASALVRNRQAIVDAKLFIVGIDYERSYIDKAVTVVANARLKDQVTFFFFDSSRAPFSFFCLKKWRILHRLSQKVAHPPPPVASSVSFYHRQPSRITPLKPLSRPSQATLKPL